MKQKNILKTILMIGIAFFIIFLAKDVKAASLSISASKTSVAPGESVTITVSSDCTGRVNLSASGGSLSSNKVWVEGNSQSVTLTTNAAGTITVTATPETLSTSSGEDVNLGSKSCSVKVAANTSGTTNNNNTNTNTNTKSSVATLANLGIRPNDFSGFTPSKKAYAVTVPNNVESIQIYANKAQSGQTISGIGTKSLKEGKNTFTITVTAEDKKTTNQYTITVTREAKEEEKPEEQEEPENQEEPNTEKPTEERFGLSTLMISGVSLDPNFSTDVFEYKVKLTEDKDKLEIKTVSTDEKAKVEVTGNENLQEGENIITILVTDESGEKTATYQIIVEKTLVAQEELAKQQEQEEKDKQMKMMLIGGAGAILIIVVIIVIIVIKRKRNKQYAEEFSIPYAGINQEEEEEEEDVKTKEDSQIESSDPMETEDKEKLRQEFLNQSFTEFEEEKPRKNRHSKGKRFK